MIEMHGWITIRETYECIEDEEENIREVLSQIKEEIKKIKCSDLEIKVQNGDFYTEFSLFTNRQGSNTEELFLFFKRVGTLAKGSYGLIYFWDDEDSHGKDNTFQVWVLARGNICIKDDMFLSPAIPTIEDACY